MNKKIENLWLDSYKRVSPAQFPPMRVEYAVLKKIAQDGIPFIAPARNCNTWAPKEKWRKS
jgi:hypothetical protein